MTKSFFIWCLFFLPLVMFGQQNLVPNGDFEDYKVMPKSFTPFYFEDNRYYFEDLISDWYAPTNGTPDYFNSQTSSTLNHTGFPVLWEYYPPKLNINEEVIASNGDFFVGIVSGISIVENNIRIAQEFIQVRLTSKLIKGRKYNFKMDYRISIISNSNFPKLGVCFSIDSLLNFYNTSINNPYFTRFNPPVKDYQLVHESADTIWTEFTYQFRSSKEDQFLTIGCFNLEGHPFENDTNIYAYYFIDNVSLIEIPCLVGQDTACVGEEVTFYSTFSGPFEWYHNDVLISTDSIIQFTVQEGWYFLKTPYGEDSVYLNLVQDLPPFEDIQKQICEGENAEIQLPAQFTFQWQDGNSSGSRNFTEPAQQWVAVSTNYCKDTFNVTVEVQPLPTIDIQRYYEFCKDSLNGIEVFLPDIYEYLWTDGHQGAYKLLSAEGLYPFIIQNPFECKSRDSIVVKEDCPVRVWMPNAFAPEGENRIFRPIMRGVEKATLVIYNRWGEKIYEETSSHPSWNGTYRGEGCMQGAYHYQLIVYKNNEKDKFSGVVHLVR